MILYFQHTWKKKYKIHTTFQTKTPEQSKCNYCEQGILKCHYFERIKIVYSIVN